MKYLTVPFLFFALLILWVGNKQYDSGNYERAGGLYSLAANIDFADLSAQPEYNLGVVLFKQNLYKQSIDQFEFAASIVGDSSDSLAYKIHYNTGVAYYRYAEQNSNTFEPELLRELLCQKSLEAFMRAKQISPNAKDNNSNIDYITAVCTATSEQPQQGDDENDEQSEPDVKQDEIDKIKDREKMNKEDNNKDDYQKHGETGISPRDEPYW